MMALTFRGKMREAKIRRKMAAAERAEARAKTATANAKRTLDKNRNRTEKERHHNDLRKQGRPIHGFSVGVWRNRPEGRPRKHRSPKKRNGWFRP